MVAGTTIAPVVQVKVADAFGNGVAGAPVALSLTGAGTLTGGGSTFSDASGVASFASLSVELTGTKQLTAMSGALTPATSTSFTVSAAAATTLSFVTQPSNVVAGVAIAPAVQVKVADAFGNGVAGASVTLALSGTGTLNGGGPTLTDTAGLASFAALNLDVTGSKQLSATSGALTPVPSASFSVSAAAAAALSFVTPPSDIVAGGTIAPAVQVRVADAFGNNVAGAPVTLSLLGSGTLTGGGAVPSDVTGLASFASLSVNLAGTKQLTASTGALTPVSSSAFTVTAGAATTLSFVTPPTNAVAGATIAPAVQVKVADAFGNGVAGSSVALALSGTGTLTGGGGILCDASGVASFAGLSVNLAGTKQLTATSGVLTPTTSTSFTVSAGAAEIGRAHV